MIRTLDVSQDPTVRLELRSRPEAPGLVRAALAGIGELLEFDLELIEDLTTAVSEACNNVVLHAYPAEPGPLVVDMAIDADRVEVVVKDRGGGFGRVTPSQHRMAVGLAVINALADRAEFISSRDAGTQVRMAFARRRIGKPLPARPMVAQSAEHVPAAVDGDVVVTLAPVGLLAGVLGRLARAIAGTARFSIDRFSDLYLVADAITAHAHAAAVSARISFAIRAHDKRLELMTGPFRAGSGALLQPDAASGRRGSALALLADELAVERAAGFEMLRVVVADRRGDAGH
jgi:serine/threonine-protein kinase RsbW